MRCIFSQRPLCHREKKLNPASITLTGALYGEAKLLTVARKLQEATDFHRQHPDLAGEADAVAEEDLEAVTARKHLGGS